MTQTSQQPGNNLKNDVLKAIREEVAQQASGGSTERGKKYYKEDKYSRDGFEKDINRYTRKGYSKEHQYDKS